MVEDSPKSVQEKKRWILKTEGRETDLPKISKKSRQNRKSFRRQCTFSIYRISRNIVSCMLLRSKLKRNRKISDTIVTTRTINESCNLYYVPLNRLSINDLLTNVLHCISLSFFSQKDTLSLTFRLFGGLPQCKRYQELFIYL